MEILPKKKKKKKKKINIIQKFIIYIYTYTI